MSSTALACERCRRSLAGAAVTAAVLMAPIACADPIRPAEPAYNSAKYKASHNSYARDESLASQVDDYNVWQIELDVYDFEGMLFVNHDCAAPFSGSSTLSGLLRKLAAESKTASRKFTMIYLDMKGNGNDGCQIGWGKTLTDRLKSAFVESLSGAAIYPAGKFVQDDAQKWPSYQALVRRGYHWGVIVDWHGANQTPTDDLFFFATTDNPPSTSAPANTVLVNIDGGCDISTTNSTPQLLDARWIYRAYPGGGCSSDCRQMNGNYWTNLLGKPFNYLATNCINWDHTFAAATHPPDPLFVSAATPVKCPNDYSSCEWGTLAFPFHDLAAALRRAGPVSNVVLGSGTYRTTAPHQPFRISEAMTMSSDGSASIR